MKIELSFDRTFKSISISWDDDILLPYILDHIHTNFNLPEFPEGTEITSSGNFTVKETHAG